MREIFKRYNDEDLKFMQGRVNYNFGGDRAELINFLSLNKDIDKWLDSAVDSDELFDMIDLVSGVIKKEASRRWN